MESGQGEVGRLEMSGKTCVGYGSCVADTVFWHLSGESGQKGGVTLQSQPHSLLLLFYVRGVDIVKVTEKIIIKSA